MVRSTCELDVRQILIWHLRLCRTGTNSINYYAPQIFREIGLVGTSSGLFATGVYGIVKIVVTAIGLMAFTEQLGRKWSLIIGSLGQAFAMFYIGVNSAVHPPQGDLDGNSIFAIICVYLFVVFYSFGKSSSSCWISKANKSQAGVQPPSSSPQNAHQTTCAPSSWPHPS